MYRSTVADTAVGLVLGVAAGARGDETRRTAGHPVEDPGRLGAGQDTPALRRDTESRAAEALGKVLEIRAATRYATVSQFAYQRPNRGYGLRPPRDSYIYWDFFLHSFFELLHLFSSKYTRADLKKF